VSLGWAQGLIAHPWIERGGFGALIGRYEAFTVGRDAPGPRLGASIWASKAMGRLATATEPLPERRTKQVDVAMTHFGALAVLRHAPSAPIGATMGFGFGRADIEDHYDGPLSLPVLTFEAGARHSASDLTYVDWMARAHWATSRSPVTAQLDEWWMVQLALLIGFHAN
jgi:hypothetical protein